ncbi:ABC transporter permease [Saccharospirillum mangrovi]|uniref:ABC transporter permease n=1 Tax=Saccharospirillum mangrovi TaxID=2161747 RepID=UPI001300BB1A|nr:ABC transporter permease [Saccharospirillum mangrovi]
MAKTFLNILAEEWALLFRHKGIVLILIGAPIFYSLFYPLPYQAAVVTEVSVWVSDADQTLASRRLVERLDAAPQLAVVRVTPTDAGRANALRDGEVQAYLDIPAGMQADLERGQSVTVAYGGSASNFLVYGTAARTMAQAIRAESDDWAERYRIEMLGNAVQAQARAEPLQLALTPLFNSDLSYLQYLVPGVYLFLVQQVLMLATGMHWGAQRERGDRSRPVRRFIAQTLIYGLHGMALVVYLFRWALPLEGVWPTLTGGQLLNFGTPFVLSAIWLGMVVSRPMQRMETPLLWLLPLSVPLLLLTGISWPAFAMADWVLPLADWLPATQAARTLLATAFMGVEASAGMAWLVAAFYGGLAITLRCVPGRDSAPALRPSTGETRA